MKENTQELYICPSCFQTCDHPGQCHGHKMICCDPGRTGDFRRKPVSDSQGQFYSSAPRWYLEAAGWIKAGPPYCPVEYR